MRRGALRLPLISAIIGRPQVGLEFAGDSADGAEFWQIIIVVVLILVLFGGLGKRGKISGMMSELAQGIKGFKKGMSRGRQAGRGRSEPVRG